VVDACVRSAVGELGQNGRDVGEATAEYAHLDTASSRPVEEATSRRTVTPHGVDLLERMQCAIHEIEETMSSGINGPREPRRMTSLGFRRPWACLALLVAFAYSGLAQTAYAATEDPGVQTITIEASVPSAGDEGTFVAAETITITCQVQVQYPHNSTHVPGMVNVVGTTKCDAPIASIVLSLVLLKEAQPVGRGISGRIVGAEAQVNAAAPCSPGLYTGLMAYWLVFPPGFFPPTAINLLSSPPIPIVC
jgi:hypothetical protein